VSLGYWLSSIFVLALSSCASQERFSDINPYQKTLFEPFQKGFAENKHQTIFLFEEDREGQIDVCPCEFLPMGGVRQASSYISKTRKEGKVVFLSAGNAVVPGEYVTPLSKEEALKLPTLVEYYNQNKLIAYGANSRDFINGLEYFRKRMSGAKFSILSSNIFDSKMKPIFSNFYDLKDSAIGEPVFRIISLSSSKGPELPKGFVRESPIKTFKELQKDSADHVFAMWIVLGDLNSTEVEELRSISQKPVMILGGRGTGQGIVIDDQGQSLWVSGRGEGKTLNRIDLAVKPGRPGNFLDPFRWERSSDLYSRLLVQYGQGIDKGNALDTLNYLFDRVPDPDGEYQLYRAEEVPLF